MASLDHRILGSLPSSLSRAAALYNITRQWYVCLMTENDPGIKKALDDVWLERAEVAFRTRITTNLRLIDEGHFTQDELETSLSESQSPLAIVDDPELYKIMDAEDINAWNRYVALHPEVVRESASEFRLADAWQAASDRQAVQAYADLSPAEAIEAIILVSQDQIAVNARLEQTFMQAAVKHGFAI